MRAGSRKGFRRRWTRAGCGDEFGGGKYLQISPCGNSLMFGGKYYFCFLHLNVGNWYYQGLKILKKKKKTHIKTMFSRKVPFCGHRGNLPSFIVTFILWCRLYSSFGQIIFCNWEKLDCQVTTISWVVVNSSFLSFLLLPFFFPPSLLSFLLY